jgi:hypothetical protein
VTLYFFLNKAKEKFAFLWLFAHIFLPLHAERQSGTRMVPDVRESGESPEQYLLL